MKLIELLNESSDEIFRTRIERLEEKILDIRNKNGMRRDRGYAEITALQRNFFEKVMGLDPFVYNWLLNAREEYVGPSFSQTCISLYDWIQSYGSNFNPSYSMYVTRTYPSFSPYNICVKKVRDGDNFTGIISESIVDGLASVIHTEEQVKEYLCMALERKFDYEGTTDELYDFIGEDATKRVKQFLEHKEKTPNTYMVCFNEWASNDNTKNYHVAILPRKSP